MTSWNVAGLTKCPDCGVCLVADSNNLVWFASEINLLWPGQFCYQRVELGDKLPGHVVDNLVPGESSQMYK